MPLENGYFYLTLSGQISNASINSAFGRVGSQIGIWEARNGYYGTINTWSGRYPTNGISKINNGYALSDWYGYGHRMPAVPINLFQAERFVDVDTRIWRFNYQGSDLGQSWQWGTTTLRPWVNMARGQRIDVYFDNNIGWGSSWRTSERSVYSSRRGWLLRVFERTSNFRNFTGTYTQAGEMLTIYNRA